MKLLHVVAGLALYLSMIALAAFTGYAAIWWPEVLSEFAAQAQAHLLFRVYILGGSIGFIAVMVLYWLTGVKRLEPEQFISFDNDGGSVCISIKAIRDFIVRLGDEFAAIIDLKPAIRAPSGAIDVELDVRVRSGTHIPELCRLLQDRVKESIRDNLGLAEIRGVKINVREIVAPPPEKDKKQKTEEPMEWEGAMRP